MNTPKKEDIQVPRDLSDRDNEGAGDVASRDEHMGEESLAQDQRGLEEGSPIAKRLHENPPQGEDQLRPGSGGDAARPGKEGVFGKPIPPRGHM